VLIVAGATAVGGVAAINLTGLLADRAFEEQSASLNHTEFRSEAPRGYRALERGDATSDQESETSLNDPIADEDTPAPAATAIPSPTPTPIPMPTATPTPEPSSPAPPPHSARRQLRSLPPTRLVEHAGEYVTLIMRDGRQIRARLVNVRTNSLRVAQRIGGGEMEFTIPITDVKGFRPLN
ncbi:MAG: hypothetical protein GY906_40755, partial [bacterium]|nr:hypothetical protein [bacterium]